LIKQFFYKATLLQQVNDLLESISCEINTARGVVEELDAAIRPIEKELNELQVKIKTMEHVEQISLQVQQLKKKLAWSWVYDVDKKLEEQNVRIEKLKSRVPTCQAKIDKQLVCLPTLSSQIEVFISLNNVKFCVVREYHIPYCALMLGPQISLISLLSYMYSKKAYDRD
jgi:DNA repair exonuclease SbcCD ATPase subunit